MSIPPRLSEEEYAINKELLLANKGFEEVVDEWIPLVKKFQLKQVPSEWRETCPFCSCKEYQLIGQYLFYSNLARLRNCLSCDLIYSDILIDDSFVQAHFELAYKEEDYFCTERLGIFNEVCEVVNEIAPRGARVLDVGGATGVLAKMLRERRPDLEIVVSDISGSACEEAKARGFRAIDKGISALDSPEKFDLILLLDVLYYERELSHAFNVIRDILCDEGTIIYRGPNKLFYIRLDAFLKKNNASSSRLYQFNPEHLYVLHPSFLHSAFRSRGFSYFRLLPSSMLRGKSPCPLLLRQIINYLVSLFFAITGKVISPSCMMIIKK